MDGYELEDWLKYKVDLLFDKFLYDENDKRMSIKELDLHIKDGVLSKDLMTEVFLEKIRTLYPDEQIGVKYALKTFKTMTQLNRYVMNHSVEVININFSHGLIYLACRKN